MTAWRPGGRGSRRAAEEARPRMFLRAVDLDAPCASVHQDVVDPHDRTTAPVQHPPRLVARLDGIVFARDHVLPVSPRLRSTRSVGALRPRRPLPASPKFRSGERAARECVARAEHFRAGVLRRAWVIDQGPCCAVVNRSSAPISTRLSISRTSPSMSSSPTKGT